jgi:hypothetical protein
VARGAVDRREWVPTVGEVPCSFGPG